MAAPDTAAVKVYLGETSYSDAEIGAALAAELAAQSRVAKQPAADVAWPADLAEALFRRVARNLALRMLPLAVLQGDAEAGSLTPPGRDPEVRRLEAPHRRLVIG